MKINFDENQKIGFKSLDLLLILITTLISIIVVFTPYLNDSLIGIILVVIVLLFLPGYSLVAVLYPKKMDLYNIERLMLSFAFPLLGLALSVVVSSFVTISISLNLIFILVSGLTIMLILIAFLRRRNVPENEKFFLNLKINRNKEIETKTKPKHIKTEPQPIKTEPQPIKTEPQPIKTEPQPIKTEPTVLKVDTVIAKKDSTFTQESPRFVFIDLLIIFLTTLIATIFIITPPLDETFFRIFFGLILVFFVPGYSFMAVLFPKKSDLDGIERATFSSVLSIAITLFIGFLLNFAPWGINLTPLLISISLFTIIMILIAFLRRRRVTEGEKFFVNFKWLNNSIKNHFNRESKDSKILSIILICLIILSFATTTYIIVKPKQSVTFTEFYLLGPNGTASNYPTNLTVGETGSVIIGLVNHEDKNVVYQLVVTSNGNTISEQNITVNNENKKEIHYNFSVSSADTKKIEFLLYKMPDKTNIYRSLDLFVNP